MNTLHFLRTGYADRSIDQRVAKSAIVIALAATFVLDSSLDVFKGPQWVFLLIYMVINITVNEIVGGKFGYAVSVATSLCRSYVGTYHWDGLIVELSSTINLIIGFLFIAYLIQKKNALLRELKRSALTDPLTQLPNRREFNSQLEQSFAHSKRHQIPMSVAYVDVDNFKTVNDTLGHDRGDDLLIRVGGVITGCIRAEDTGARLGGDEFGIILNGASAINSMSVITRLKIELDDAVHDVYDVSFSIGVVDYDGMTSTTAEQIVKCADSLMYVVKKTSKNAIKIHQMSDQLLELGI